jgi:hypothetical protein
MGNGKDLGSIHGVRTVLMTGLFYKYSPTPPAAKRKFHALLEDGITLKKPIQTSRGNSDRFF